MKRRLTERELHASAQDPGQPPAARPAHAARQSLRFQAKLVYEVGTLGEPRGGSHSPVGHGSGFALEVDFSLTKRRSVLFGPSGAGKSTLLRLLAGLLEPDAGTISLGQEMLTDTARGIFVSPGKRGIGYLTQTAALFPHLSVENNIAFGLHGLGRQHRRERVARMLTLFSLDALALRMPLRLSGGERRRVALARALAPDPALLLLDEPFTGLDTGLRDHTIAALDEYLQGCQTTVLSVSHDVAEVYASDAEVLLIEAGRVTAQGPSRAVLGPHRERLLERLGVASANEAEADSRTSTSILGS